jgi:putative RNA 2'-phosphotransferase
MTISASKFLSYVLRHRPESIGIELNKNGWAEVTELIEKANADYKFRNANKPLTADKIRDIVSTCPKQRFALSNDGTKIRASQGHSVEVNLQLRPVCPPAFLFHGTTEKYIASIVKSGLKPQNRQHVHLSADVATAISVGSRHGKPIVLIIKALMLYKTGHEFFLSENGVWLTEHLPSKYIEW